MRYKQMTKSLDYGEEYSFIYKNKKYWISQNESGNYLTNSTDKHTQEFKNSDDLLKYGRVDNKSIEDIWEDIKEQFQLFNPQVDIISL